METKKQRPSKQYSAPEQHQSCAIGRYPKPKATGGRLIREVISLLRKTELGLPVTSHILIAVSGGADSIALAHLLITYGRRVVDRSKIKIIHINHGWRGAESDGDQAFVEAFAQRHRIPVQTLKLAAVDAKPAKNASWEDVARTARKKIFAELAAKGRALIFTAHHADDLAETMLWRVLTGTQETHGGGIALRHGFEVRPLLAIRKNDLMRYLREEGEGWREDSTNHEGRFMRSKMRVELMPVVEKLFPRSVEHLTQLGLKAQLEADVTGSSAVADRARKVQGELQQLFSAAGLKARRAHWESVYARLKQDPFWEGEVHLPAGWTLVRILGRKSKRASSSAQKEFQERWILEKR